MAGTVSEQNNRPPGRQRVALVFPFPYLDTVPSLCNAVTLLAKNGFGVDIYTTRSKDYQIPSFNGEDVSLFTPGLVDFLRRILPFLPPWSFLLLSPLDLLSRIGKTVTVWRRQHKYGYRCFIGVDAQGLVEVRKLCTLIKVPLAFWSLELLLSDELTNHAQRTLKRRELELSRRAVFTIIQDIERANLLAEDNGLPPGRFFLVPNSPPGPVHRRRCNYWHQYFGLSLEKKIVLHAGSVGPWTGIRGIIASVYGWPDDWVLVVHTRFRAAQSQEIEDLRRQADPSRVFFSLEPAPREKYDELVDSADAGIAFYVESADSTYTQENIRSLGLSSGKIAYYLRSGLPVIVNLTARITGLMGPASGIVTVPDESKIGAAIETIAGDYDSYSESARSFFEKNLDFNEYFAQVIEKIKRL